MKKMGKEEAVKPIAGGDVPVSGRGRGRPLAAEGRNVSRSSILRAALRLTKTTPLSDLSILMVARSMMVTPGLIHYYIGGRDWLTSGVINLFYRDLLKIWPKEVGDWQIDLVTAARTMYDHLTTYPGVCAYIASNNRFRIFQLTEFSDRDWGVEFLERFSERVHAARLPPERSAIYVHMIMNFVINVVHNTAEAIYPAQHSRLIEERTAQLDPKTYPNIFFGQGAPLRVNGIVSFEEGCRLILLGMVNDLNASEDSELIATHVRMAAKQRAAGRRTGTPEESGSIKPPVKTVAKRRAGKSKEPRRT